MTSTQNRQSRRAFLKLLKGGVGLAAIGAFDLPLASTAEAAKLKTQVAIAVINGLLVPKWTNVLPNPLDDARKAKPDTSGGTSYTMTVAESWQDYGISKAMIEPYLTQSGGRSKVWGYANAGIAASNPGDVTKGWATEPGATFDLDIGTPIQVTFKNGLVDSYGRFLPNPMPVDYSIDWANPGALGGFTPVPVTTHLHGSNAQTNSDGQADSWFTPPDWNLPNSGPYDKGRLFNQTYTYSNDLSEGGHLWYHDHVLGITRLNVNMGLAGHYFLRDANERALQANNTIPSYPYEVPLIIHDRLFMNDGNMVFAAGAGSMVLPVNSILPEFFGETMTVNSKAWPVLNVEPRKYRLRILNASDARFYELQLKPTATGTGTAPTVWVIGNELGFLNYPVVAGGSNYVGGVTSGLAIGPGERYDVVIDFSGAKGTWYFGNTARTPYPNGQMPATGLADQVMAFNVSLPFDNSKANAKVDITTPLRANAPVATLSAPDTSKASRVRKILIAEGKDKYSRPLPMVGPIGPAGGYTLDKVTNTWAGPGGSFEGTLLYRDPVTEYIAAGTTEVWEFYNTTPDAHPMHMHLVNFRVVDREPFSGKITQKTNTDGTIGFILPPTSINLSGKKRPVKPGEAGRKDTVQCFPNEVTRILVTFDKPGEYLYHCHILSHEDHEMMRRYLVV